MANKYLRNLYIIQVCSCVPAIGSATTKKRVGYNQNKGRIQPKKVSDTTKKRVGYNQKKGRLQPKKGRIQQKKGRNPTESGTATTGPCGQQSKG